MRAVQGKVGAVQCSAAQRGAGGGNQDRASIPDHMPNKSSTDRVSMVCIMSTSIFNNECRGRKGMIAKMFES